MSIRRSMGTFLLALVLLGAILPAQSEARRNHAASAAEAAPTLRRILLQARNVPADRSAYAITGRVSDGNGNPLANVILVDSTGRSAWTDTDGQFRLADLPAGAYTITPAKAGYTFSPPSRTVAAPPGAAGQDFTASGAGFRRPVILLPGMGASVNWGCFLYENSCDDPAQWDWTPTARRFYQPLLDRLAAAGYSQDNHYLTVQFYDWRQPLAANVAVLKSTVDALKAATGGAEVDLIGHSMGGLLGRAYVQGNSYGHDVAHLITLGSPHQGAARAYPFWQAAYFYRTDLAERLALSVLLFQTMRRARNPIPVYALRQAVPSFRDILPTTNYLYDERRGDQVKPEAGLVQRNTYLADLNANLASLFDRAEVTTLLGQGLETPARFYVQDRAWWEWPNWDDGKPNWSREPAFMDSQGDGTVTVASAGLPAPADVRSFPGVDHGGLPGNDAAIDALFDVLGIPLASEQLPAPSAALAEPPIIALIADGPVDLTLTDPQGRAVGPDGSAIPGAVYVADPDDPFKMLLLPAPAEGAYRVDVAGRGAGTYALALLDTFGPAPSLVSDVTTLWDVIQSHSEPEMSVSFALSYTLATSPTIALTALTPVIAAPLRAGSRLVAGLAQPGNTVEVRSAANGALLGITIADDAGRFVAALLTPLRIGQRIYARANGVAGAPVTVEGYRSYLPSVSH